METTLTLARNYSVTPFAIFEQDIDDVIMVINHYIYKGNEKTAATTKEKRIRVNDATATGGWY